MTPKIPSETNSKEASDNIEQKEQSDIAGYNPRQTLQLEDEYKLTFDSETPPPKPFEEGGMPRATLVIFGVGFVLLLGFSLWLFIKPKQPKVVTHPEPATEKNPTVPEEKPDYRAKLALQDQKYALKEPPTPTIPPPKQPTKPVPKQQNSPKVRTVRQYIPSRSASFPVKTSQPVVKIDPVQSWNQLAANGQISATIPTPIERKSSQPIDRENISIKANEETLEPPENSGIFPSNLPDTALKPSLNPPITTSVQQKEQIPFVTLGNHPNSNNNHSSPGAQGILQRERNAALSSQNTTQEIAFGTMTSGVVSVPLIWDEGSSEQGFNRFGITLTEDLLASDGSIALPAKSVIIAEVTAIGNGNHLVQATAIALIYPNEQGEIQQEFIPPGTILIKGENGQPLIGIGHFDPGFEIATQDFLISALNGLGRIGEVFTQPEQIITNSNSIFGGSSSSVVIKSRNPEIWAAILDGFFNPLANRISERNEEQINQLLSRPNIIVVPTQTKVSVITNGFIKISK